MDQTPPTETIDIVEVFHDYQPPNGSGETLLGFKKGDILEVHAKDSTGWWHGTIQETGQQGWFPSNYVRPIKAESTANMTQRSVSNAERRLDASLQDLNDFMGTDTQPTEIWNAENKPELPQYWKAVSDNNGRTYYHNIRTNHSTYNFQDVIAAEHAQMVQNSLEDNMSSATSQIDPIADYEKANETLSREHTALTRDSTITPKSVHTTPYEQSRLENSTSEKSHLNSDSGNWDNSVAEIQSIIQELTKVTLSVDAKAKYILITSQVMTAVRTMLGRCDALTRDSKLLKRNKTLRSHHQSVITSLAKLVISAKIAAGIWPPSDAVQKIRFQANQVLSSINYFVTTAKELKLELSNNALDADALEEFEIKASELCDIETVARMEGYSEAIIKSNASLSKILEIEHKVSKSLIEQIKLCVTEVGQFMSLIEDLKVYYTELVHNGSADPNLVSLRGKKDQVYSAVNNLITYARVCMDDFAPADAFETLLQSSNAVIDAIEHLVICAKLVIDQSDYSEKKTLMDEAEYLSSTTETSGTATSAKLYSLQRRAQNALVYDHGGLTSGTSQTSYDEYGSEAAYYQKTSRSPSISSSGIHTHTMQNSTTSTQPHGVQQTYYNISGHHAAPITQQNIQPTTVEVTSMSMSNDASSRRLSGQFSPQQQRLQQQLSISTQLQNGPQVQNQMSYPHSSVSQKPPSQSGSLYYPSSPPQPPPSLPPPPTPSSMGSGNSQTAMMQQQLRQMQLREQQQQAMRMQVPNMSPSSSLYSTSPSTQFNSMQQMQLQMQQMQLQHQHAQQQMLARGISVNSASSANSLSDIAVRDSSRFYSNEILSPQMGGQPNFSAYDKDEIQYGAEGQILGATLPSLVERLTHESHPDKNFLEVFMTMFHSFSTSQDLFSFLLNRFFLVMPSGLDPEGVKAWQEKKQKPIRLRVYNVLIEWLDNYWMDAFDDPVLEQLQKFALGPFSEAMQLVAHTLVEAVNRKITAINIPETRQQELMQAQDAKLKKLVARQRQLQQQSALQILSPASNLFGQSSGNRQESQGFFECFPPPIIPRSMRRLWLVDIDPTEIARQLTIIEMKRFCGIGVVELMNQEWNKTPSLAINVRAMIQMQTKISGWVAETILMETEMKLRVAVLKHFIKIADKCLSLNNFNTLIAIQSALGSSAIVRLKQTWENLGSKHRQMYDFLRNAIGDTRNYADYKNHIRTAEPPCLPCLNFCLVDLNFTEDGNPNTRNGGRLINFEKYTKICKIIKDLQRFQVPYPLTEVAGIQKWLLDVVENSCKRGMQELFRMSLELEKEEHKKAEATQRDMDSKFRMLERAGLL